MDNLLNSPDEWWAGLSGSEKAFFRNVIRLAGELLDEEVLILRFNGWSFSSFLMSKRRQAVELDRMGGSRFGTAEEEPEEWWASLPAEGRSFIQTLGKVFRDLIQHQDQFLEIESTGDGFLVRKGMELAQPVGGNAKLN